MQQHGIKAGGRPKFVATTDSKHNLPIAPVLLQRDFAADGPNSKWTSDITCIPTDEVGCTWRPSSTCTAG